MAGPGWSLPGLHTVTALTCCCVEVPSQHQALHRLGQQQVGPISSELPEVSRLVYQVWGSCSCSSWNPSKDDLVGVLGTSQGPE